MMKLSRIAPLALVIALTACTSEAPIDNPNNEQDNPNMPYEGDQDPEAFFDGTWNAIITPSETAKATGKCGGATAVLTADNGTLTGTAMTEWEYELAITATVMPDGVLAGGMAKGDVNAGTFEGTMEAATAEGTWKDAFGCEGTFTMTKA